MTMDNRKPLFTLQQYNSSSVRRHRRTSSSNDNNDNNDNNKESHSESNRNSHQHYHQNSSNGVSSLTFLYRHTTQHRRRSRRRSRRRGQRIITDNLHETTTHSEHEDDHEDEYYHDDSSDEDNIPSFRCRSILLNHHAREHSTSTTSTSIIQRKQNKDYHCSSKNLYYDPEAIIDQAIKTSFAKNQTYLASCHVNGDAHVWDLNRRQIAFSLVDRNGSCSSSTNNNHHHHNSKIDGRKAYGPGLCILQQQQQPSSPSSSSTLFYQTRDDKGSISIHNLSSSSMDGCRIINTIECHSRTFCQMACSSNTFDSQFPYLIATPSKHESIVSLWDIRCSTSTSCSSTYYDNKPVGIVHGAGLDLKRNSNSEDWRKDGMLMSLKFCDWGKNKEVGANNNDNDGDDANGDYYRKDCFALGCGMESGNLYIHDIRKLNSHDGVVNKTPILCVDQQMGKNGDDNTYADNDAFNFGSTHFKSIKLGMNPILALDMLPSSSMSSRANNTTASIVSVAGTAGDANDQLELPENKRGTINVIKITSSSSSSSSSSLSSSINNQINARIRAKVGTCKIDENASFMGKPGVNICKLNPNVNNSNTNGGIFAVGGWDKRVRIYSRTSAKLLNILRGPNEDSISALDWVSGESGCVDLDLINCGLLAAGSGDGKIMIWRTS